MDNHTRKLLGLEDQTRIIHETSLYPVKHLVR